LGLQCKKKVKIQKKKLKFFSRFFSPTGKKKKIEKEIKKEIGKFSYFSNFKMDLFRKNELQVNFDF
jgi:hypothetical protein